MALMTCPECRKEISDRATHCIGCGYPVNTFAETTILSDPVEDMQRANTTVTPTPRNKQTKVIAIVMIVIVMIPLLIILYNLSRPSTPATVATPRPTPTHGFTLCSSLRNGFVITTTDIWGNTHSTVTINSFAITTVRSLEDGTQNVAYELVGTTAGTNEVGFYLRFFDAEGSYLGDWLISHIVAYGDSFSVNSTFHAPAGTERIEAAVR